MQVVEDCDGIDGVDEMMAMTSVIPENPPVLESGDRVLDARSATAMSTPRTVTYDPVTAKHWNHELVDAAVTTIGKYPTVAAT